MDTLRPGSDINKSRIIVFIGMWVGFSCVNISGAEKNIELNPFNRRAQNSSAPTCNNNDKKNAVPASSPEESLSRGASSYRVKDEFIKGAAYTAGALMVAGGAACLIAVCKFFLNSAFVAPVLLESHISVEDYVGGLPPAIKTFLDRYRNPKKYKTPTPKGYIFWGPPGSGKTYLAQALAGELDCPFFSRSGTDFLNMYHGGSEANIRDIFKIVRAAAQASPSKKAILFIDEIDSIAAPRTTDQQAYREIHNNIVNTLLTQMDGLDEKVRGLKEGEVIVIGATNSNPEDFDPALIREGRLGVHIKFEKPTPEVLAQMLDYQIKKCDISFAPAALDYLKSNFPADNPGQVIGILRAIEEAHIASAPSDSDSLITTEAVQQGLDRYGRGKTEEDTKTMTYFS